MTTLITGASGFIGLALTETLLAQDSGVVGYDLSPPPEAARRAFAALPGGYRFVQGDVLDETALRAAITNASCERLVTLAAITADAAREKATPALILAVNAGGAIAAVAAGVACGVKRVLHVSSGAVYGASGTQKEPLDEVLTPLRPEGLYGISKQAAEAAVLRLARLHGLDLTVGRLGTCFGPWEFDTGVRDTLSAPLQVMQHLQRGSEAILPRPGRRDWLYVRDAAAALIALLDLQDPTPDPRRIYNVAAGFEWSISDWCTMLARVRPGFQWRLAGQAEAPTVDYYAPYDRASMDNRRLLAATRFTPHFDMDAAADDFLSWRAVHEMPAQGLHGASLRESTDQVAVCRPS